MAYMYINEMTITNLVIGSLYIMHSYTDRMYIYMVIL